MTDLTVLVVCGGLFQGLGLLRCLRQSGRIRVVLADAFEQSVTRYFADSWRRVPEVAEAGPFVDALVAQCAEEAVRLVLPATAHALLPLAHSRERFSALGVQVGVSSPGLLRLTADKAALSRALVALGLPVLPSLDPESAALPLIGKPAGGFGGRNVVVLRSPQDREQARRDGYFVSRFWQRYLTDCDELSADFAIGFDGVPGPVGLRWRVRTSGGFAVVSENVEEALVGPLLPKLLEWLRVNGGRGLFNVQFLVDRSALEGQPRVVISDVNPRFGTSSVHWNGVGANPVLFLCASVEPRLRPEAGEPGRPWPTKRLVRSLTETWFDLSPELTRREQVVKAVVFDLDDTLIDHKAWILGKILSLIPPLGVPAEEFGREALRQLEEGAASRLIDVLVERFGLGPDARDDLLGRYRAARPQCPVHTDVWPTLESLRRRGYRLALLTDSPPEGQRQKVEAAGLGPVFDEIVFARETGGEKPGPSGFAEVARRLGLAPESLAMVGDNPWRDVAGALDAGYSVAYQVRRPGSVLSFDERLFRRAHPTPLHYRAVEGLQPLLVFLEGLREAPVAPPPPRS